MTTLGDALRAPARTVCAAVVADPVLALAERGPVDGVVRGVGAVAAYLDFDGFIVTVTPRKVGLMPNGVAVRVGVPPVLPGSAVRLAPGGISTGRWLIAWNSDAPPGWRITWNPGAPPGWDPRLRPADPRAVAVRGSAILAAIGIRDPGLIGHEAVDRLLRSVAQRDASSAALAAERLIGSGPGLTPEGDDALAAVAAVVATLSDWDGEERETWLQKAIPGGLRSRTTALSATLIELARGGCVIEPLHRLFDVSPRGEKGWRSALGWLMRTGSSTGRTYAAGSAAAAVLSTRTHQRNQMRAMACTRTDKGS